MYPINFNELPNGYAALENEPEFIPPFTWPWKNQRHSIPCLTWVTGRNIGKCPCKICRDFCVSRAVSEGAETLYHTVKRLEEFATSNHALNAMCAVAFIVRNSCVIYVYRPILPNFYQISLA